MKQKRTCPTKGIVSLIVIFLLLMANVNPVMGHGTQTSESTYEQIIPLQFEKGYAKNEQTTERENQQNTDVKGIDASNHVFQIPIAFDTDPCYSRFASGSHPGIPDNYKAIDTLTYTGIYSGSGSPSSSMPYIVRDSATDIRIGLFGATLEDIHASISATTDRGITIEIPKEKYLFDYAIVSAPAKLFPGIQDGDHVLRFESSGEVFEVPTLVDLSNNRVYIATSDFCTFKLYPAFPLDVMAILDRTGTGRPYIEVNTDEFMKAVNSEGLNITDTEMKETIKLAVGAAAVAAIITLIITKGSSKSQAKDAGTGTLKAAIGAAVTGAIMLKWSDAVKHAGKIKYSLGWGNTKVEI
jgi:hypothetical protein